MKKTILSFILSIILLQLIVFDLSGSDLKKGLKLYKKKAYKEAKTIFLDIIKKDIKSAIRFLHQTLEKGLDPYELAKALVNYLRQGMLLKITGTEKQITLGLTEEEIDKLNSQIEKLEQTKISQILENFLEAGNKIKYSSIPQLPIELAIIESCE